MKLRYLLKAVNKAAGVLGNQGAANSPPASPHAPNPGTLLQPGVLLLHVCVYSFHNPFA